MFGSDELLKLTTSRQVSEKLESLDIPFGKLGFDPFGISKRHLGLFYSLLEPLYRHYFKVKVNGLENVPSQGRAMLIGNHSGGIPVDAGMIFASIFLEADPPRHVHGMVEKFAQNLPFLSPIFSRIGQFTGLPEHAVQILEAERLLLAFPEGVRGTGKLYSERYQLERFGTGFMRIALQTQSPIVPFAFVGGEEAMPVIYHAPTLAKLIGVPYIPIPKHLIPIPKPEFCQIVYGPALHFEGSGNERDSVIQGYVNEVKEVIVELIAQGRQQRDERIKLHKQEQEDLTGGGKISNLSAKLTTRSLSTSTEQARHDQ
ncbi:MAG: acyltransferase [Myxococcales bacterium]|nr:acyltransferase [Myxococcales bacterium]